MANLTVIEREVLYRLFQIQRGFLFKDWTDSKTFHKNIAKDLILEACGINIYTDPNFQTLSQQKCIEKILAEYDSNTAANLIEKLCEYFESRLEKKYWSHTQEESFVKTQKIVQKLRSQEAGNSICTSSNKLIQNEIIACLNDILAIFERTPQQYMKFTENELSNLIADFLRSQLQGKVFIEREAPMGYGPKKTGQADFYIFTNLNGIKKEIAIGENKFDGKFRAELLQLIGYLNENFEFGFTITINNQKEKIEVIKKQKQILQNFEISGNFKTLQIRQLDDYLISEHQCPENGKIFRLYHLILNLYRPSRIEAAKR